MFTGIVEHLGTLEGLRPAPGGKRLRVDLGPVAGDAAIGDSIAVDGACLTITALDGSRADFDVSGETLRKTTVGEWAVGRRLNLERALALGQRLGGHLVSGHVDGVGRVVERRREGEHERFVFALPEDGSVRVIEKGSVAVDGISLTTWDCRGGRFSVAVIPHTLAVTTLGDARPGRRVNLEQDLIGRWVESLLPGRAG